MTNPSWGDFGTHDESAYPELWDGVVGAWCPSLGPTGLRLHDHSRRSNWGTLTNMDAATDWVVSGGQYALDFDGSNDYVTGIGSISSFAFIPNPFIFTLAIWFNLNNLTTRCSLIGNTNTGAERGFLLIHEFGAGLGTNAIRMLVTHGTVGETRDLRSADSVVVSGWNFAAIVGMGSAAASKIYVNGVGVSTTVAQDWALTAGDATRSLSLGNDTRSAVVENILWTPGRIDDTKIWNRALTANEIQQLYLLGRGGMYQRRRRTLRRVGVEQGAAGARRRRILTGMV